ncbi:MAG: DUF5086 family protein [Chthoniobacteraceae bacterium]
MKRFLVSFCLVSLACTGWAAPDSSLPVNPATPAPVVKPGLERDFSLHAMWVVDETAKTVTWVEIHQTDDTQTTGIFHVSVYLRGKNPRSDALWVCHHLAITREALERSLIRPLKRLGLYPESFEAGYHDWQQDQKKGTAFVCTTTIADFVKAQRAAVSPAPRALRADPD